VAENTKDSRRAIAELASGYLARKLAPQVQVFLKGFYKFIAVYCHAGTQNMWQDTDPFIGIRMGSWPFCAYQGPESKKDYVLQELSSAAMTIVVSQKGAG
jgi:hypothetical protein